VQPTRLCALLTLNRILVLLVVCVSTAASFGDAALERELKLLVEQREKALAAAAAPIDARFKVAADQLLRRATQAGDLDAANKIKAAIDGVLPRGAKDSVKDLRKQLVGTNWKTDPNTPRRPGLPETLTFTDSTIEPNGHRYEVNSHNTLTVIFPKGDKQPMTLTKDGRRLEFTRGGTEHVYEFVSP
jgi:hypothetical protein